MRDSFISSLCNEAKIDDLYLITADLGFGIFDNFVQNYPDRFINVGVAEQSMIGVSTGLGLEGFRTVAYSIANFSYMRCLEQIRNDAAYHDVNLTIVCSGGGFTYGQLGMSHHATEDIGIMRSIPSIDVCVPCSDYETSQIFNNVTNRNNVSYLRIEKNSVPDDGSNKYEFGKLRVLREGEDIVLIGCGGIVEQLLIAHEKLVSQGYSVKVISAHTLKPFDDIGLISHVKGASTVITMEEHNVNTGLASIVSHILFKNKIQIDKFKSFAIDDKFCSVVGDQNYLRDTFNLNSQSVLNYINGEN